jgi:hypothetical protein
MKTALTLLLWCAASALGQSSVGAFTPTGAMTTARSWHTATLQNNGQVLIVGGVTPYSFSATASAELYDPARGTFSPTGNMTAPRATHTATLLPDGRVLIAGGSSSLGEDVPVLTTAEIYDPSTGTFTATSDMLHGHECGQAHVLNNGKVLLSGGSPFPHNNQVPIPDAQLYDPTTRSFAAAGTYAAIHPFSIGCGGRAETLLSDGRVLIVWEDDVAEIYDPETGSFTQTGKPLGPPWNFGFATATLLMDGNVMVAGGAEGDGVNQDISKLTELFDVLTGSFTPAGSMPGAHDGASATLLPNGAVLIAGGDFGVLTPQGHAVVYDPVSDMFRAGPEMVASRLLHTATLLNDGRVLIAGGFAAPSYPAGATSLAELYTPDVLTPAPALLSVSADGQGQGAILHAGTARVVTARDPGLPGEVLEIYGTGLKDGSVIPPRVVIGGRLAEILHFGNAPGFTALNQVNVRVPSGVTPGPTVSVRLTYLARPSNEVTIGVR